MQHCMHGEKQLVLIRVVEDGRVLLEAANAVDEWRGHQVTRVRQVQSSRPAKKAVVADRAHEIQLVLLLQLIVGKKQAVAPQSARTKVGFGEAMPA